MRRPYAGRFAPTPTGPLHFGSLLTAVASYLDARANDGTWHLRIDDLDTPRVVAGAESAILRTLECHGLLWDGPIVRQRERSAAYAAALASPRLSERCFYCTCSRKSLAGRTTYPGTCRAIRADPGGAAIRIQAPRGEIAFEDLIQGRYAEQLAETTGDFVVYRRDAIAAYQLAVVVDDDAIGITRVVRGADLLDNTPRQLYLIERLELATPSYAHIPVIAEASGAKLSKHTRATAVNDTFAAQNLRSVVQLLGQTVIDSNDIDDILEAAIGRWNLARVPKSATLAAFVSL